VRLRSILLVCLLALPLCELIGHAVIVWRVPASDDYRAAAGFIRARLQPRDLIAGAPAFIDPIVRWQLGDRMPLAMVGRSDDAAYERMWVLSIRNALPSDAPKVAPDLTKQFGHVRVLRYALAPSPVLFDFVAAWAHGEASITRGGNAQPCRLRHGGVARGGGLGRGVLMPVPDRFECDPARPQLFVGPVVLEDLDNRARSCLWQHPQGDEPVSMTFHDVPLGDELLFYAGIYYEHERMREGGPIDATIAIDGVVRATFHHEHGDGFRSLRLLTASLGKERGDVTVAVRAHAPARRSFCWSATTRRGPPVPPAAHRSSQP
jgi:hypothetical protein